MKREPLDQPVGSQGRGFLMWSAGLNLLLLAVVLGLVKFLLVEPPPAPTRTVIASEALPVPEASLGESGGSGGLVTNLVPFRWAQLESEDFRVYIANLRAVHCPERIIHDLVFHDLERVYEAKEAALPNPDLFWKPGRVRERAGEERESQRRQLELEKRSVMRALLGVWWSQEAWEFWYDDAFADIAEVLVGFLTNEEVLEAVTIYHDMREVSSDVSNACELCSEADERGRQEAAYQRVASAFAGIMSPAGFEEMALRICLTEEKFEDFSRAEFRFRNGTEVRDFAKLVNRFKPFFSGEFLDEDETTQTRLQSEVRVFFGKERFAAWERSQNAGYQEIWQFGQELNLPQATILQAWQVREAVEQELSRLSDRPDLSSAERAAAWNEVRQQTESALTSLLGAANCTDYLKQHGSWLKTSPPNYGGNP